MDCLVRRKASLFTTIMLTRVVEEKEKRLHFKAANIYHHFKKIHIKLLSVLNRLFLTTKMERLFM